MERQLSRWGPADREWFLGPWRVVLFGEVVGPLRAVSYREVMELGVGQALLWAVWVNDARLRGQVIRATLRPSCVRAGGETRGFR